MSKSIFKSRAFWWNIVSTVVEVAQLLGGVQVVPPGTVTLVTNAGNIALRRLTDSGVHVISPRVVE